MESIPAPQESARPRIECEGCSAELESSAAQYGPVGRSFCFDCWQEELRLRDLRVPTEAEIARLERELTRQAERVVYDEGATLERIDDLQDQLDTLTLRYQVRHGVVGRKPRRERSVKNG